MSSLAQKRNALGRGQVPTNYVPGADACRRGSCASLKGPRRTWRRGARTRWGMTTLPALPYRSWPWCNGFHHAFRYRSCAHGSTCGTLAPPLVVQRWRALRCGVRVAYSRACVVYTQACVRTGVRTGVLARTKKSPFDCCDCWRCREESVQRTLQP